MRYARLRYMPRLGPQNLINLLLQVYLIDDVHMNPEIYPDPLTWDPARYAPGREEDKKVPNAFLGWGAGFHPCRTYTSSSDSKMMHANQSQWE